MAFITVGNKKYILSLTLMLSLIFGITGCTSSKKEVIVYTSVDQVYSEKLFSEFEKATGIKVKAVYDTEATKAVGLSNRLIAERENPKADVFWNGEILQTINLKKNDVLDSVSLKGSEELPSYFIDKNNMWYAFGGRARVVIYNSKLISREQCPKTMNDFGRTEINMPFGMAYPVFGTTSTHAAVMYSMYGKDDANEYYKALQKAGVNILDGNGVVKDYVSQGKLAYGITDTDDALTELNSNKDLDIVFLDQGENEVGTLVIPNTVALIKGAPNKEAAVEFMEFLISKEAEQFLTNLNWIQIPVHNGVKAADIVADANLKIMEVDFEKAFDLYETAKKDMLEIFIR